MLVVLHRAGPVSGPPNYRNNGNCNLLLKLPTVFIPFRSNVDIGALLCTADTAELKCAIVGFYLTRGGIFFRMSACERMCSFNGLLVQSSLA